MSVKVTKLNTGTIFTFTTDKPSWAQTVIHPRTKEERIVIGINDENSSCSIRLKKDDALELFKVIIKELETPNAETPISGSQSPQV